MYASLLKTVYHHTKKDFIMRNQFLIYGKFPPPTPAALGLLCCAQAFSSCGKRGLHFIVVRGFLIAVASPAAEHGL